MVTLLRAFALLTHHIITHTRRIHKHTHTHSRTHFILIPVYDRITRYGFYQPNLHGWNHRRRRHHCGMLKGITIMHTRSLSLCTLHNMRFSITAHSCISTQTHARRNQSTTTTTTTRTNHTSSVSHMFAALSKRSFPTISNRKLRRWWCGAETLRKTHGFSGGVSYSLIAMLSLAR